MIKRNDLATYLSQLLNIDGYNDYCINGLQVEGCDRIERIVTGVSVSERLLQTAVECKADAVIVHHGIFWRNTPHPLSVVGIMKRRLKLLLENEINLFGYHLPLDGHEKLGNNALIAEALGLTEVSIVPVVGDTAPIAAVGSLPEALDLKGFAVRADEALHTDGQLLQLQQRTVSKVFVLSGGGSGYSLDAAQTGADLLVTGELKEDSVRAAEENGLNLYAAGHYNSEKLGIRALGEHIADKLGISVEFIDIPNPV